MAKIVIFPSKAEHRDRLAQIESDKISAMIDAEIVEIKAKVDADIRNAQKWLYAPLRFQMPPMIYVYPIWVMSK